MFIIIFYIFSFLLSYTDFKRFLVPNNIVITMTIMMLTFGFLNSSLALSSILLSIIVLIFFIVLLLLNRHIILGGGDIKYMMIVALYLGIEPFALFLIVTGVLQTIFLLFIQKIKKRKIAPMVPIMFLSVIIVDFLTLFKFYPFKF